MIIELTHIEPDDGRHYCSSVGQDVPALERLRLDVQTSYYTKHKVESLEELQELVGQIPCLPHQDVTGLKWFEFITLRYQRAGETTDELLIGIGYTLTLYGAEVRPTRLHAELGPAKEETT